MRMSVGAVALIASAALALPVGAAPLTPVGKWALDNTGQQCTLSHQFGQGPEMVTLGLQPGPLGETFHLLIVTPHGNGVAESGQASIDTSVAEHKIDAIRFMTTKLSQTQDVSSIKIFGAADWFMAGATTLTVDLAGRSVALTLPNIAPALSALRKCHDDLLTSWGVTPAERALIGPLEEKDRDFAIGKLSDWVSFHDYPRDALAARQQGTSGILWTIGVDGRAHDCRVVSSSGVPSLDTAACSAIMDRARYRPVLDHDGQAIVLHAYRDIHWSIPS